MTLKKWNGMENKVGVLQTARNKYGPLKVAQKFDKPIIYKGNEIEWSKHIDVLDIWETGEWWRIHKANNRQILQCEIVLDVDPEKDETPEQIKAKTKIIIDSLNQEQLRFKTYFSGSRGYHIHLMIPELGALDRRVRTKIREQFIKKYNCDLQKASDNTMIAMEHCAHWKTGNKKVVVENEEFR